jgi:hypothetical protein
MAVRGIQERRIDAHTCFTSPALAGAAQRAVTRALVQKIKHKKFKKKGFMR